MKHHPSMQIIFACGLFLSLGMLPCDASPVSATPEFQRLERDGIIIEYPPEWRDLAEKTHEWIVQNATGTEFTSPEDISQEKQEEILQFIAEQVAFEAPTEIMRKAWDKMREASEKFVSLFPTPKHIRLWQKEDILRYLEDGGEVPGCRYDREQRALFMEVQVESNKGGITEASPALGPIPFILTGHGEGLFEELQPKLQEMLDTSLPLSLVLPIHESAQFSIIVDHHIMGPDRRWFCEGVSSYLTTAALGKCVSQEFAKFLIDKFNIDKYQDMTGQVNLVTWKPDRDSGERPRPEDEKLNEAHAAYATHEIMGLVNRHGEEIIPKIFKRLREIPLPEVSPDENRPPIRDMGTVYDVIEEVTGENFRARLLLYFEKEPPPPVVR
ncbi:MAG TPA: hypothetical protein PLZ55_00700 [bacterium]|nr:hypothetical protein [bacterium]